LGENRGQLKINKEKNSGKKNIMAIGQAGTGRKPSQESGPVAYKTHYSSSNF